jgi:translation initiation factor 1 (eIF-1/SUI1)
MSAQDKGGKGKANRIPVDRSSAPLGNPFAALDQFEAIKALKVEKPGDLDTPNPSTQKIQAGERNGPGSSPQKPKQEIRHSIATPKKPAPPAIAPGSKGRLILRREKKDRGGKTVVVVYGFKDLAGMNAAMIANLSRDLKNKLGCGGSFDRQEIVLQGDRAGGVAAVLESMGYRVDGVKEDGPPG